MKEAAIKTREGIVDGYTRKVPFACGNLYITLNIIDGKPFRVFLKLGKAGACQCALLESIARLTTIMLQEQITSLDRIYKTLTGVTCDKGMVGRLSCVHVFAQELKSYLPAEGNDE